MISALRETAFLVALLTVGVLVVLQNSAAGQPQAPASEKTDSVESADKSKQNTADPGGSAAPASPVAEALPATAAQQPAATPASQRTTLNLLGQEDTKRGESRRNENVQFNLIDTNTLQELNIRLGATATIVTDFRPELDYYGSEYGRRPPPSLHLPRSQGQGIHGSLFETHGNSVFSARSFFQVGGVQPAHENRYGFRLGAPLWQGARINVSGNQNKIRGQVNGNILVPLPGERTPLTTDPEDRPIVEQILAAYPEELPNRTDIDPRALNTNAPQRINTDTANIRLDQNFGDDDRFGFSYVFTSQSVDAFQLVKGQNPDTDIRNHRPRITWNRTWSPNTISDFSVGYVRIGSLLVTEPENLGPNISAGNAIEGFGASPLIPVDRAINTFRYGGRVRHARGSHQLTAGFHLARNQLNGVEQQAKRGNIRFTDNFGNDAIRNLRLAKTTGLFLTVGEYHRGYRNWTSQLYIADNWRATQNLSLSMGLRYELATVPREVNDFERLPYSCDCNNFAPRFGFAYRLGDAWGVLRGAYGISYGEIYPVTYSQFRLNAPNVVRLVVQQPKLSKAINPDNFRNVQPGDRSTLFDFSDNLVEPYVHQYSLSWEFALSQTMNLQLGYVGSRAHKVFQAWFLNRGGRPPGIKVTTGTLNERRPDDRYNDVLRLHNASRAYYDAGRVSFVMRDLAGFTIDAAYWFSKSIDLGSDYTNTMNGGDARRAVSQTQDNIHADVKSVSFFDQPHSFLIRAAYETPGLAASRGWLRQAFGSWEFSTITLLKTGTPFTVRTGSDAPGFGNVDGASGDRPNLLDPSILGRTIGDPDTSRDLLPLSAFAPLTLDDLRGNLGLRTFRRGQIANVNASLSRTWAVASEKNLTFRVESINFFNTPQFAEPNFNMTSPSFGRITNTLNDGRTFRFTLQFDF